MLKHKYAGYARQFIVTSQAWYTEYVPQDGQPGEDKIYLGLCPPEGRNLTGEFVINWEMVGQELTPRLQVFCGSWSSLLHFQDVITELAKLDGTDPSVEQVVELLTRCGVIDATERVRPKQGGEAQAEQLSALTEVCRVYQSTVDRIRNLVRNTTNDPGWGVGAELGNSVKQPANLDPILWEEFLHFARAAGLRRAELTKLVDSNETLKAGLHDLLVEPEDLQRIKRAFK